MAVSHQTHLHQDQRRRSGRSQYVLAGGVGALLLFVLSSTIAVLALLGLAGTTGGMSLFRGKAPRPLVLLMIGALLGTTLFIIFAWYDVATSPPTLYPTGS
jgi:hypothetical protein